MEQAGCDYRHDIRSDLLFSSNREDIHKMMQTALNFNPLPRPEEIFPADNQDRRLFERMILGPVSNAQMRDELRLLSYTRRLSDLREKLFPYGLIIRKEHHGNGVFVYSIERHQEAAA